MKFFVVFIFWTIAVYYAGNVNGKNSVQKEQAQKQVTFHEKKEDATRKQEKTAEKIKIKYERFKSKDEECNFVLDYDVSKCLCK